MTDNHVKNIIRQTVAELKRNNMIRTGHTTSYQKTEKILYMLPDLEGVDEPFLTKVRESLDRVRSDPDFEIIDMKYFQKMTHEEIAELIDVDPRTISRRKNKLVKRLSFMLFPSEAIEELLND